MPTADPPTPRRRRRLTRRALLLGGLGAVGAGASGAAYAFKIEPHWACLNRLPLDLPRLHPDLHGLRLVQLSDLHVSHGHSDQLADLGQILAGLHPRLGVFAVFGNHDYSVYSYQKRPASPGRMRRGRDMAAMLADFGVTALRNERHVLEVGGGRLQLVGLDDYWAGLCNPEMAMADVEPDLPCLVLSHNPDTFVELKQYPGDFVLSGHTHGGQVRIPLFGAPVLPIFNRRYDAGLFREGDKCLYVNRGLGYIRRVRFNCRPEITEFTLVPRA
ncbi:MAG: metallophosphoesterase [Phycisphaerae bacterium]